MLMMVRLIKTMRDGQELTQKRLLVHLFQQDVQQQESGPRRLRHAY